MKKWAMPVALIALVAVLAGPALAGNGKGRGGNSVEAKLLVPDGVYGGSVDAYANPGGSGTYVLAKCYVSGTLVWGGYFAVDANNQATVGPFAATTWPNSAASCTAEEGYFQRDGFGKWVSLTATTFNVAAA